MKILLTKKGGVMKIMKKVVLVAISGAFIFNLVTFLDTSEAGDSHVTTKRKSEGKIKGTRGDGSYTTAAGSETDIQTEGDNKQKGRRSRQFPIYGFDIEDDWI
jgi:hypothetical protein